VSETAPEAPPRSGGGNVLTRKLGPLPTWVWVAIVSAIILAYVVIKQRGSSSSTASGSGTTADASQVPQFVNQTYTTVSPPAAPDQGAAGPPGPPGPAGPPAAADPDAEADEREPPRRGRHKPKPKPGPRPKVDPGGPMKPAKRHGPPVKTPVPMRRAA
jgi:hypothetical protein